MTEEVEPYTYRCPNLECKEQYAAILKDQAPEKKPRCVGCDTPFLAKHKGHYIHYQSLRFD